MAASWLAVLIGAVGSAYVAHAELQQAADLAAAVIRSAPGDAPLPRARQLALLNGASSVRLTELGAGRRVRVSVVGRVPHRTPFVAGRRIRAVAIVELSDVTPSGGVRQPYVGVLVPTHGIRLCPAAAQAFDALFAAAAADRISVQPSSGWRSYAEQAALFATLGPGLAAAPGTSRHHDGTEVDIAVGPAGSPTHRWLQAHAASFGFIQRYSWEPWHWGSVRGC